MGKKATILQRDIITLLEAHGYPAYNIITASKSGVADILACIEGLFASIEVKVDDAPSMLQEVKQDKIRTAKGYAIIARSLEDVFNLITQIKSDPRSSFLPSPCHY